MTDSDIINAQAQMNRMYRYTRFIYDASRKYYLLGRDHLIEHLDAKHGEHVVEAACGTARNLVHLAREYPHSYLYGFDVSDEMLKTARHNLLKNGLGAQVRLTQGNAESFDPAAVCGRDCKPDKIIFSYALSIIPTWRESIDRALDVLPVGGQIHIIDFGDQKDLPGWFRKALFWWLRQFHVYHKPEIALYLESLQKDGKARLQYTSLYKGYTYYAVLTKL